MLIHEMAQLAGAIIDNQGRFLATPDAISPVTIWKGNVQVFECRMPLTTMSMSTIGLGMSGTCGDGQVLVLYVRRCSASHRSGQLHCGTTITFSLDRALWLIPPLSFMASRWQVCHEHSLRLAAIWPLLNALFLVATMPARKSRRQRSGG
ncbi:hypothetical protein [Bradyrhizobium sp. DASA03007]|uniref:hypothetical protein n=1 Tax=unclassified Bradyrhizobium TaxID=2631580 RepID=UPI003F718C55